ncbi:MAG: phosphatidylserine/phosphatidylglycerophosphate/cardiolipin synthase family protein [Proteobacteria bacterium]|nr:phosphatidylserine/phosphatidylglycerophosphate/cardiolipin synthase family protein [Pseudomonadota bacterium]
MERYMLTTGRNGYAWRGGLRIAMACLLAASIAGCAGGGRDMPADPMGLEAEGEFGAGLAPHLGFGASAIWSSVVRPIKEPVSTLHRVIMLTADTLGGMITATFKAISSDGDTPAVSLAPDGGMDLIAWEKTLNDLTGTRQTLGTAQFMIDGDAFYPVLYDAIAGAEKSVDVRLYIFDTDDVALDVADRLKNRAGEVRTRVLLDGLGSSWASGARPDTLPAGHRAPLSIAAYLRDESAVTVRIQANPLMAGDHTKSIVVDGKRAFLGGMNIGREYRYEWHDMMVELRGPVVAGIRRDFESTWDRASLFGDIGWLFGSLTRGTIRNGGGGAPMRLLATRPGDDQIRRARFAAFERAQNYIFVQTPYLADDDAVDRLAAAARRGVDVRVILPERNDSALMDYSNREAAQTLLAAGARIYIYPGFTHAKAMLADGWAMFGSANMDWLSHAVNREMDVATSDPDIAGRLKRDLFMADFRRAREIGPPETLREPLLVAGVGAWQ